MAVVLITGRPGAGKSLAAVQMLVEDVLPTGREVFAYIDGLDYEGLGVCRLAEDGEDLVKACQRWHGLPDGSVIFIDECQRVFPVRNPASKVPEYISQFETHRHHGLDIYLITQGPKLIDRHLHDLVDRHVHLFRSFGLKRSTRYDWNGINLSPDPVQDRDNAQKKNFIFPKKYFSYYKSASVHTVRTRIPWKPVLTLLFCIPLCIFFVSMLFSRLSNTSSEENHSQDTPDIAASVSDERCEYYIHSFAFSRLLLFDVSEGRLVPSETEVVERIGNRYIKDKIQGTYRRVC